MTEGETDEWNRNWSPGQREAPPTAAGNSRRHFDCWVKKNKRTIQTLLISSEQRNKKTGDKITSFHQASPAATKRIPL